MSEKKRPSDVWLARGGKVEAFYRPANSRRDLPAGSGFKAMDAFLLSSRVQDVVNDVAEAIADDARALARAEGLVRSGVYSTSFGTRESEPVVLAGEHPNPRRGALVVNDAPHAASLEFGTSKARAYHVLERAAEPYRSPKGA